ncbi:MAG TPA: NAD-dependent malic enzyme [Balneola sp.]|jgi:malate dehydrogenase (oxaloacetate-decarboxylating)|nr:NAD-dependent malic enzyme [Bacteroidota bacterium]MAC05844.1 NAD-dependent malic enzyme [Balneola sp.]MAO77369.1 NAD-dependent malic enzyme [Balneola sp.]MBF65327.1 NAD-dependent malic enzyme [Balneola sp.]HAH50645.1 NAD-dependent malic enzyme [Balneola sp.]|tara:strand:- start:10464 stop:11618 length:1155 start_codon:yes stop_codon:yes gene_type:complete
MSKKDYAALSIEAHKKARGKISIEPKMPLDTKDDLSIAYTPGVAEPCREISKDVEKAYDYTAKGNLVAVVSDGSAVLGLGNIGPEAALPVMEGKAVLFKKFANVDAVPIVLNTQDTEEIITAVKAIAPTFGGINLEDISAPRCFEIEERLKKELSIPVFHDDQHGTAIVTLAGMFNACKLTGRKLKDLKVVINGAGAAGVAIVNLLFEAGVKEVIMCDSRGIIHNGRTDLNDTKKKMSKLTNKSNVTGNLEDAVKDSDVFIGVSAPGVLTQEMVKTMTKDPIIFAMANPTPEIMPDEAREAGARIIATGRSDFANQINNVLAFPGLFRGALDARTNNLTSAMFIEVAKAIADSVEDLSEEMIIPSPFDDRVPGRVAEAVRNFKS